MAGGVGKSNPVLKGVEFSLFSVFLSLAHVERNFLTLYRRGSPYFFFIFFLLAPLSL